MHAVSLARRQGEPPRDEGGELTVAAVPWWRLHLHQLVELQRELIVASTHDGLAAGEDAEELEQHAATGPWV
jgi:hypothetical protein